MGRLANKDAASRVAPGKIAARRVASGRGRPIQNEYPARDDAHDAIDLEFLRIWMRIARLRERIRDEPHTVKPRKPRKPPMNKVPRRTAA
jgi:hypothetical protein